MISAVADQNVLCLRGFLVGKVSWTSPPYTLDLADTGRSNPALIFIYALQAAETQHPTRDKNLYRLLSRLLTLGVEDNIYDMNDYKRKRMARRTVNDVQRLVESIFDKGLNGFVHSLWASGLRDIGRLLHYTTICTQRSFFRMEGHLCGNGPRTMRTSDKIAIFEGGLFAHVLRPVDSHFMLVGQAYIPGLMEGEVFSMGLPLQEIRIR